MMRIPIAWLDWLDFRRSIALIAIVLGGDVAWLLHLARVLGAGHADALVTAAVTTAPLVGLLLAPALIGLFFGAGDWVAERVWTPWQGIYRAFDDHQIRVVEARGVLWFSSVDVRAALGLPRRPGPIRALRALERHEDPEAGEMLSNAGLARLFGRSTDRSTLRLLAWAERDVHRPWQRAREATTTGGRSACDGETPTSPRAPAHP